MTEFKHTPVEAFQMIRTSGPATTLRIPPVSGLLDRNGARIGLDCDVILQYGWQRPDMKGTRGRVITIGDAVPGTEIWEE